MRHHILGVAIILLLALLVIKCEAGNSSLVSVFRSTRPTRLRVEAVAACRPWTVEAPARCEYVRKECAEMAGNFVSFLELHFCGLAHWPVVSLLVQLLWLLLVFVVMLVACDRFFCPSIERISEWLRLSPVVAGATLLAFGNGATDLFTQIAMAMSGRAEEGFELALTEPLGTGMFVTNVVVACIILVTPRRRVQVCRVSFMKDCLFFLGGVLGVLLLLIKGSMETWQVAIPPCYYLLYIIVTIVLSRGQEPLHADPRRHEIPHFRTTSFLDDVYVAAAAEEALEEQRLLRKQRMSAQGSEAGTSSCPQTHPVTSADSSTTAAARAFDDGRGDLRLVLLDTVHPAPGVQASEAKYSVQHLPEAAKLHLAAAGHFPSRPPQKPTLCPVTDGQVSTPECKVDDSSKLLVTAAALAGAEPAPRSPFVPACCGNGHELHEPLLPRRQLNGSRGGGWFSGWARWWASPSMESEGLEGVEEGRVLSWWRLCRMPIRVLLSLTLPLVSNRKNSGALYPKPLAVTLPVMLPLVLAIYADFNPLTADWTGDLQLQLISAVCLLGSFLLLLTYPSDGKLRGGLLGLCTLIAFLGSMVWMRFAAEEVVAVTVSCGTIFEINSPLLAATFLSWAGAAGDTINNLALARDGFPTMALTACFSSPLFVLLGGLTCTLVYFAGAGSTTILLPAAKALLVLYGSCVVCSVVWVLVLPLVFRYKLTAKTAAMAFTMYLIFQLVYIYFAA